MVFFLILKFASSCSYYEVFNASHVSSRLYGSTQTNVRNVSMSTSNISKSVLSTPRGTPKENENSEIMNCQLTPVLARFKVEQGVDEARCEIQKEAHQKRLKLLRKELDYIQATSWKYEPIESYIKF